jgi:hypothetical protein
MLKKSASREGRPGEPPLLAQRAVSEDPRWTRAVRDSFGSSWGHHTRASLEGFLWSLAAALLDSHFEPPGNRGELYSISIDDEMGIKIRQSIQAATPTLPEDLFG